MTLRACLIVDNPQRDLDGMVLVAWHVARSGGIAYLVPMYTQGFDVNAIMPDVVLANYVRPNNVDLLKLYRSCGVAVAVLDSEGAVGRSLADKARVVAGLRSADYVDAYCFWGERQRDAFIQIGAVPRAIARLTGCPRYDFCAPRWRAALPHVDAQRGYVLIATNFIVVNPRYTASTAAEVAVMKSAGNDAGWAERYATDAKLAYAGLVDAIRRLTSRFPRQRFVVRPHPFEAASSYDALRDLANCEVRDDGPSLAWLNGASLLLHLNSSTAVEAAMLGVEPISLEWLNTETLSVATPVSVSRRADSYHALEQMIAEHLDGRMSEPSAALLESRTAVIRDEYLSNDGGSAARVAVVLQEVAAARRGAAAWRGSRSARSRIVHAVRCILGYRSFERLRGMLSNRVVEARRTGKYFSVENVTDVLRRLDAVAGDGRATLARDTDPRDMTDASLASGRAVCVYRSD